MSVARTVAEILAEHVTLEIEGIDRMYLNVYVPRAPACGRGGGVLSGPPRAAVRVVGADGADQHGVRGRDRARSCASRSVPLITFSKGQRKDDVAEEHLARFTAAKEGVLFVGKAQEKASVFRTEKRRTPETGRPYPWLVRSTAMVNQYYFYCRRSGLRPVLPEVLLLLPVQRQAVPQRPRVRSSANSRSEGIAFEALDNGLLAVRDPPRLQAICDGLAAEQDRRAAAEVAGAAAASVHARGSAGRLPLRALDPAGRVLADPGAGPAADRAGLLRGGDPREPRHRPPRPGAAHLRSARHPAHARAGSAPG